MSLTCALVVIAVNIDSLAVGAAYGMAAIKISILAKFGIALSAALAFAGTILLGGSLGTILPEPFAGWFSAVLLMFFGGILLADSACSEEQVLNSPEKADSNADNVISFKESVILSIALSVDSLGVGFSLGLMGAGKIMAPFFVFVVNVLFLLLGEWSGRKLAFSEKKCLCLGKIWLKKLSAYIPGLVLVALAFWKALECIV